MEKSWLDRIDDARRGFRDWEKLSQHIIRKFRSGMASTATSQLQDLDRTQKDGARYNVLFANVEALLPALFTRAPTAVASRRHRDRDAIGRVASEVLTRAASAEIEKNGLTKVMEQVSLDLVLQGRGLPWIRYDFDKAEDGATSNQHTIIDHVHYLDFVHSDGRTWADVQRDGWVARRVTMTRGEGLKRFGKQFAHIELTLNTRGGRPDSDQKSGSAEPQYAEVWEIWDRKSKRQIFAAKGLPKGPGGPGGGSREEGVLETRDDPYGLETFFPCPEPVYSTLSNEDLIPTPDYEQYRDQAAELDRISGRIKRLTEALKLVGAYDSSAEGLAKILSSEDGTLVPVPGLGKLGGASTETVLRFMPVRDIAEVLVSLYEARRQAKDVLDELSGVADIVRGQGDPNEKATTARIKSSFVTSRLDRRKRKIEECARDVIRMMTEMMIELFPPDRLREQSGFDFIDEVQNLKNEYDAEVQQYQQAMQQFQQQVQAQQQQAAMGPPPQMAAPMGGPEQPAQTAGPEGAPGSSSAAGPPGPDGGQPPAPPLQPPQPPPQQSPVDELWGMVMELLKNERMRGFRIDVESGSTVEVSDTVSKTERTEYLTAVGNYLANVMPVMEASPDIAPVIVDILSFTARSYKVGRSIESSIEEAAQKIRERATQAASEAEAPEEEMPPPDPRVEADAARTTQATQIDAQTAEAETAKAQAQVQEIAAKTELTRAQAEREKQKIQIEQQEAQLETAKGQVSVRHEQQTAAIEGAKAQVALQHEAQQASIEGEEAGQRLGTQGQAAEIAAAEAEQRLSQPPTPPRRT